jgi:hypothetical protein
MLVMDLVSKLEVVAVLVHYSLDHFVLYLEILDYLLIYYLVTIFPLVLKIAFQYLTFDLFPVLFDFHRM